MSTCQVIQADSPTLKRSFDAVRDLNVYQYRESSHCDGKPPRVRSIQLTRDRIPRPSKKIPAPPSPSSSSSPSTATSPAMPVPASAPVSAAFPSFMSVFGGRMGSLHNVMREDTLPSDPRGGTQHRSETSSQTQTHYPILAPYQHRQSSISVNSDSTNSSPTTTISTFDSPSVTDPSPSSSPESPSSLLPLSSFQSMMGKSSPSDPPTESAQPTIFFHPQPGSESPTNKERNVKNLSLNMTVTTARPATASAAEGIHAFSAPTSPLRGPLRTGRRRPNNLTIQTPGFDKTTFSACEIPPTPCNRPYLTHHESSPALPSLLSPTTAPLSGMQLPPIAVNRLLSRPGSESSFSSMSVSSQGLQDLREEGAEPSEPLKSQEAPERGYPDGPVRIYESGIYLYLEPSREEATKFDTIINVAKEVPSPFSTSPAEPSNSVVSVWRSAETTDSPEPQTAVSDRSFRSALEWPQPVGPTSPTTPKARPSDPEYIHVPWDHNSEILDDLHSLCEVIDHRVSQGKKVLVHCQLGVSRSASLVIAYGLYKGFKTDFHAMYTWVKERSQWVGPNMSLIYQLMDFRAKVASGELAATPKPAPQQWFLNTNLENEMTPRPLFTPTEGSAARSLLPKPAEPWGALTNSRSSPDLARFGPLSEDGISATRKVSLPTALSNIALSSPLDSAAIDLSLPQDSAAIDLSSPQDPAAIDFFSMSPSSDAPPIPPKSAKRTMPRPLRLREGQPSKQVFEIPPHTPRESSGNTFKPQSVSFAPVQMDLMMQDVPPTPSIFSPRTTEFRTMSFDLTDAGDLATETKRKRPGHRKRMSVFSPPQASLAIDPRSPHQDDKSSEILRSIDEVL